MLRKQRQPPGYTRRFWATRTKPERETNRKKNVIEKRHLSSSYFSFERRRGNLLFQSGCERLPVSEVQSVLHARLEKRRNEANNETRKQEASLGRPVDRPLRPALP